MEAAQFAPSLSVSSGWLPGRRYALNLPDNVANDSSPDPTPAALTIEPVTRLYERYAGLPPAPSKDAMVAQATPAKIDVAGKPPGMTPIDTAHNGPVSSEHGSSFPPALQSLFTWHFDGQAFLYENSLARTPGSLLNPRNAYVQLPNFSLTGELRPNARAMSQYVDLVVQPRLSSIYQAGGVENRETVRGYFQEAFVRLKPFDNFNFTVGRELLTWGPAFFRSPSNPFYFNNARLDPIIELSGIDLARATYAVTPELSVTGGVIFGSGHGLTANDSYRESLLLKADYTGSNYLGSLNLTSLRGRSLFIGGYGQATVNDATLIYGEFGASSAEGPLNIPATREGALFSEAIDSRRSATALIGGSYTLENGQSIYAEYLYNGFGYGFGGERQYFKQAALAGNQSALGGSLGGLATQGLGLAATRAADLLGRHYLYLQYQNNPSQGDTLWRVMAAENLIDFSIQPSAYFEQSVTDRASLFALATANVGSRSSEFGALFRFSVMFGIKMFLF